ncbi:peptidoglycan recognition family protein [Streptomyces sp. NPDC127098]|uniref:peptidoglycan recognition protein family protein n=1 Tax=Streptomyces sp. NPDC127098 TaxID=3347137 RepID=UPI0036581FB8
MRTPHTDPIPPTHRQPSRLPRRAVIGAASGVAAAGVLTPAVFAVTGSGDDDAPNDAPNDAPADDTGPTERFATTRTEDTSGATEAAVGFPLSYVGLRLPADGSEAAIRFPDADAEAAGATTDWQPLNPAADCGRANEGATLVAAHGASRFELRLPDGVQDAPGLAVDTERGTPRSQRVPDSPQRMRGTRYLSRAEWGADESLRFDENGEPIGPLTYYPVQAITVHHTATTNEYTDAAAEVRAIYTFHIQTNGWTDIGYHFLIDREGLIYEGHYTGDDGIPAHDAEGNAVTASHVGGMNSGNVGIALLGTLVDQPPTDAARDSLVTLVALLSRFHGLDPQGQTRFVNPVSGAERDVSVVSGHQDWMETECPGAVMYAELDAVRAAAARAAAR